MRKIDYAIITAGGNATRFRPYSLTLPKAMLPLNGRPVIEYVIDECMEAKIYKIIIVVKQGNDCIKKHLQAHMFYNKLLCNLYDLENICRGISIVYEDEKYCYGNAAPILTIKNFLDKKSFAVLFGDDIILGNNSMKELLTIYNTTNAKSVIAASYKGDEEIHNYGNLEFESDSKKVKRLIQKPKEHKLSNYVVVSRIILDASIFEYIDSEINGESDIGVALDRQAQEHDVRVCIISGIWVCVDSPEKYRDAINTAYDYMVKELERNE